jgi:hypothetical protein
MTAYTNSTPTGMKLPPLVNPSVASGFPLGTVPSYTKVAIAYVNASPATGSYNPLRAITTTVKPQMPIQTTVPKLP